MKRCHSLLLATGLAACLLDGAAQVFAAEPPPPRILGWGRTNGQATVNWSAYPAAQKYSLWYSTNLGLGWVEATNGQNGFAWTITNAAPVVFQRIEVTPLSSNALLAATVLNRLAYGPTPDELERILTGTNAIGPQAYIEEQLAPETIPDTLNEFTTQAVGTNNWRYVEARGTGSSSTLYVYLSSMGDAYLDDLKLVLGSVAGVGPNLISNGGFELPLAGSWQSPSNFAGSHISTDFAFSGSASLHLVASGTGTGQSNSVFQIISPALSGSQTYTLSYWYLPLTNRNTLNVRLSGSGIVSTPETTLPGAHARLTGQRADLADLRGWFCMRAVSSPRQLHEILTQFWENHFVTQHSKSQNYLDSYYDDFSLMGRLAADMEFREISRWRQAMLNPQCTFHDLLVISAESPAMIIYLDTVNSRGNARNVANENYARELLELFTFGVDNGYDQVDITEMSKAWTGWSVNIVDAWQTNNPFALRTTNVISATVSNVTAVSNLLGVWSFNYKDANHNTNSKTMFYSRTTNGTPVAPNTVPARFGAPWAGRAYGLVLPIRTGTNGIQDGYDILAHLANQPFTQEYISVKLCRLFVHDDFNLGYDFTDPNLSPEGQLVRQCMLTWENSNPRGNIRSVLRTIFNSELFRSHGASQQKVKTPLEFAASTIRALRSVNADGTATASTTGYDFSTPLNRMGTMQLFERADPDGYPESGPPWISAGTLAERLRFAQSALIAPGQTGKTDAGAGNLTDPVALVRKKLPSSSWANAGAVADYFLGILFPGEGQGNLQLYRAAAINFLNTADNGATSSAFSSLSTSGTPSAYEVRLRGMVAMLMSAPRFQEQ